MNMDPNPQSVALYWDFENLHAGLVEEVDPGAWARPDNRFKVQEPLVDVAAVIAVASALGPVAINRAYCNWQFFGRYRDALLQGAVELIQLFPPGQSAKNGADIKLCLDAAEDIARFPHIGTVLIVGGDSDFMPVARRSRLRGERSWVWGRGGQPIGTGPRAATISATTRAWSSRQQPLRVRPRQTCRMALPRR